MKSQFDHYYRSKVVRVRFERAFNGLISYVSDEYGAIRREMIDLMRETTAKAHELQPNEYRCGMCEGVFTKAWSDEEAKAEQADNGWASVPVDVVCDECYKLVMPQ